MARGGARNRSGPQKDESSGRSERLKFQLTALPEDGYEGVVPEFPIPAGDDFEVRERELEIWADCWRTPQACAWSMEPWRHRIIGQYCRLSAIVELAGMPPANMVAQLHRFRDQLGLTPAGLKENGWKIASAPVSLSVVGGGEPVVQERRSRSLSA